MGWNQPCDAEETALNGAQINIIQSSPQCIKTKVTSLFQKCKKQRKWLVGLCTHMFPNPEKSIFFCILRSWRVSLVACRWNFKCYIYMFLSNGGYLTVKKTTPIIFCFVVMNAEMTHCSFKTLSVFWCVTVRLLVSSCYTKSKLSAAKKGLITLIREYHKLCLALSSIGGDIGGGGGLIGSLSVHIHHLFMLH